MKKDKLSTYFDENHHLTTESIALCTEAMVNRKLLGNIPEEVSLHVQECDLCSNELLSFAADIENNPALLQRIKNKETDTKIVNIQRNRLVAISSAAAVLIIIVSISIFAPTQSPEELFIVEFKPYPNIITTKSAEQTPLTEAMLFYDLQEYNSAIEILEPLTKDDPSNHKAEFYLGISYLSINDAELATECFQIVANTNDKLKQQAMWYLALSYIKLEDVGLAIETLEALRAGEGSLSEKAGDLIAKLRKAK